ncbi:hypothetical protein TNCV_274771 [Trichonephila clavipes]|nr:hypothetical protein TNCV_274771 [Trichonephila clavipes]
MILFHLHRIFFLKPLLHSNFSIHAHSQHSTIQPLEDSALPVCSTISLALASETRPPPAARSQHQANQIPDRGWRIRPNPV